ncbi:HAMP domain-containing sensor histidine kinase [uncultured Mucilaginibacter sp.]|uniref:sensor histidine kinase n=1 Tax=uncultured Mucilaginibacter sp. TaxID=797541 RepID=UPI0025D3F062|nr:HAMP domain-containing sensor histidine kinase [uncultured Mucilaginibacter sp.]
METYYFKSIPKLYRVGYQKFYTLQNLSTAQVAAIIFFVLSVAIRLFITLLPPSLTRIHNFPEFSAANWATIIITPLFYLSGAFLIKKIKTYRNGLQLSLAHILLFSTYLLACGIVFTFMATSDPSRNIIIYMVALIAVGGVYTFEYQESILLTLVNILLFSLILLYTHADPTEILYNELLLIVLAGIFFFVSRHIYSYRASQYIQFKMIKEKNVEIEKASAFKNDVLGMVAHDLRNPIGAVESIAQLIEMDELDDDMQENMNMIKASCRKALSIINDLLEVARNDNSNQMTEALVDMNSFLQGIVQVWQHVSSFTNELVLTYPQQPVHALIDQEKFHRVIDNLISNAAKFSKDKERIEILLSEKDTYVQIDVRDYGMGIPEPLLPNIFDRFSKAGRRGLKGEKSTGLGLSISKQIVEKHHGRIDVQSIEGKGTTFSIRLPRLKN